MYAASGEISKRINFIMFELGINQIQLAKMLNITQPAISKYLKGRVPPPFVLLNLAKFSGKSIEWILTGVNERNLPVNKVSEFSASYILEKTFEEKVNMLPDEIRKNIEILVDSLIINQNSAL